MKTKYEPLAYEELAELQKFAESEGFTSRMEMWDIPYWQRRQRNHKLPWVTFTFVQKVKISKNVPLHMHKNSHSHMQTLAQTCVKHA